MKYQCIRQHGMTDCGAACLATVSKQHGMNVPISKIKELAGTDKQGTNVYGMVKAAEALGFSAKGVRGGKEGLFSGIPTPSIAHVFVNKNLFHYVVIHKITNKKIIVADPRKGVVKYSIEDFLEIWTGVLIILVPKIDFQKEDAKKNVFLQFLSLILPHKKMLAHVFVASFLIAIFGILSSFYFRIIIDEVLGSSLRKTLIVISIGIILLYLLKGVLEYFRNNLMLYLSQKIDIPLNLGYYNHILSLPLRFFDTRESGDIIARFMDAAKIREAISNAALIIMIDTVMAFVGGGILYQQNHKLFFISIVLIFMYGIIVFMYNPFLKRVNEKMLEENAQVTSYLVESLSGIETIKAYNGERKVQYRTEILFVRFLKSLFRDGSLKNGQKTITETLAVIGETVILWVGTLEVLKGAITMGQLITYNVLLAYFLTPVKNLINLQPSIQMAIVAAERLNEIFELAPEQEGEEKNKLKKISLKKDIRIVDLNFRYGTRKLILKNINMNINVGDKVALVGESGSGKTTLVKLLLNFYDWEKGKILFGKYNLKDIDRSLLREKIAYIPQTTFLFKGTIIENLRFGNPNASLEDIIEVCRVSHSNEFIEKMPARYNSEIEENGSNLSGGQKQRLAIARALLKRPEILIMDESTSNLDSITERAIGDAISGLSETMTTIIIAHRLSTIKKCNKIFVLENGRIVESGCHTELLEKKAKYYRMWNDQN